MHTIPFVIVLCFFVLWAVSSGMFNLALRFVAIEGNRTPGITLQVLHPAMLYMLIYESNSATIDQPGNPVTFNDCCRISALKRWIQ
jgi:hypothetical protein